MFLELCGELPAYVNRMMRLEKAASQVPNAAEPRGCAVTMARPAGRLDFHPLGQRVLYADGRLRHLRKRCAGSDFQVRIRMAEMVTLHQ